MRAPGDEGRVHVDACATCLGCEKCRWVATQENAAHVIEVKVKVRHFCEHHGIGVPDRFTHPAPVAPTLGDERSGSVTR
jgi:hypothetical protein